MKRGDPRLLTVLLLTLGAGVACQRSEARKSGQLVAGSASAGTLDDTQLASARRVALESATAALKRRDLTRLKQLDLWVKNRAQVAIFEPDDSKALELAITCLEQAAPGDALEQISALKSGTLRGPARAVCQGPPPQ